MKKGKSEEVNGKKRKRKRKGNRKGSESQLATILATGTTGAANRTK